MTRHLHRVTGGLLALLAAGCATDEVAEPIVYSDEWFRCDSRFECIAVYDAFCKYTGVNASHSLIYQDWARQQVERVGELLPCDPADDSEQPHAAQCRQNRCEFH